MGDFKVIFNEDSNELENDVNEFMLLMNWLDQELFYFQMYKDLSKGYYAFLVFKPMEFDKPVQKQMRTIMKKDDLEKKPELMERLNKARDKFFPKREMGEIPNEE